METILDESGNQTLIYSAKVEDKEAIINSIGKHYAVVSMYLLILVPPMQTPMAIFIACHHLHSVCHSLQFA